MTTGRESWPGVEGKSTASATVGRRSECLPPFVRLIATLQHSPIIAANPDSIDVPEQAAFVREISS